MHRLIRKIWTLLEQRERKQLFLLVVLMVFQACLEVVSIGSILPFMGLLERPETIHSMWFTRWAYETFDFSNEQSFLIAAGILVLVIFLLVNVTNTISLWAQARFAWMRSYSISRRLLECYLHQPYPFFLQRHSAEFNRNIYQGVGDIILGVVIPLVVLLSRSISVLLIIALLLYINWEVSLGITVLFAGTYAVVFLVSRKALTRISRGIVTANEVCYRVTGEAFQGIKEAKIGGLEADYLADFSRPGYRLARLRARRMIIAGTPRYILEFVAFGGMLALLLVLLAVEGSIATIIPTASVFAFAGYRMLPSISQIFMSAANIRGNAESLNVVIADLALQSEQVPLLDGSEPIDLETGIRFEQVSFRYGADGPEVLREIDLVIHPGESIAIVGPTGSGKTTLIDLLLGLLEPTSGVLRAGPTVVHRANVRAWQALLGYVPQNIFLADTTIAGNIAMGKADHDINHDRVRDAARLAGLHDFISSMKPDGYQTLVGERGLRLSGGQVQRLGIARAIYLNPAILVLDEATSALDAQTEQVVMEGIRNQSRDRTVVIIAHRLSTIQFCDRIVVLDEGHLIDTGTWDELMDRCSRFRQLAGENPDS